MPVLGRYIVAGYPLIPCNGCWMGLEPSSSLAFEKRLVGQRRVFAFLSSVLAIFCVLWYSHDFIFSNRDSSTDRLGIAIATAQIMPFVFQPVLLIMISCTREPIKSRHLVYLSLSIMAFCNLSCIGCPVDGDSAWKSLSGQLLVDFIIVVRQAITFRQVSILIHLFRLPFHATYLVRWCINLGEIPSGISRARSNLSVPANFAIQLHLAIVIVCFSSIAFCRWRFQASPVSPVPQTIIGASTSSDINDVDDADAARCFSSVMPETAASGLDKNASGDIGAVDSAFDNGSQLVNSAIFASGPTPQPLETLFEAAMATRVHVFSMSGDELLDQEIGHRSVLDVKEQLIARTVLNVDQVQLVLATGSTPLLDSERLAELDNSRFANDGSAALSILMIILDKQKARAPFALGQDASWGEWETMSNSSDPFLALNGLWQRQDLLPMRNGGVSFSDFFMIDRDILFDAFEQQHKLQVWKGRIYARQLWWLSSQLEVQEGVLQFTFGNGSTVRYDKVSEPGH